MDGAVVGDREVLGEADGAIGVGRLVGAAEAVGEREGEEGRRD